MSRHFFQKMMDPKKGLDMKIIDLSMPIQSNQRWAVSCERVLDLKKGDPLIALPLKLAGCEGAPARVIALLD